MRVYRSSGFSVTCECPECGKVFKGSNATGDMYTHMAWAHVREPEDNSRKLNCEFCGKVVTENSYTSHILVKHPEEQ